MPNTIRPRASGPPLTNNPAESRMRCFNNSLRKKTLQVYAGRRKHFTNFIILMMHQGGEGYGWIEKKKLPHSKEKPFKPMSAHRSVSAHPMRQLEEAVALLLSKIQMVMTTMMQNSMTLTWVSWPKTMMSTSIYETLSLMVICYRRHNSKKRQGTTNRGSGSHLYFAIALVSLKRHVFYFVQFRHTPLNKLPFFLVLDHFQCRISDFSLAFVYFPSQIFHVLKFS